MKKLTVLLFSILISFSSYAGWFGNSIEGAFDIKLGEVMGKNHFSSNDSFLPKYPLNLFDSEEYYYKLTPENKVYSIKLWGGDNDIKCNSNSGNFHKLLSILKEKYGIKFIKTIKSKYATDTLYRYTDGNRSIHLSCAQFSSGNGSVKLEYKDNTTRTRESTL
jgi:hypothetical protein